MQDIKKFIVIVGIIVVGGLSLLGFWWAFFGANMHKGLEFEPIAVEADQVRRGSIVRRITVVGKLRADNEVVIHPEIEGKISKINFEGGMFVEKGTPLIEIDDEVYKARVKEAEASLVFYTAELQRYTTLAEKSAGPLRKKEEALANKLQAEAKLELAKIQLDNTVIKAPFSGLVSLKQFSVGSFVDPRTELLTLVDVDPIKVDFRVPAVYLKNISRGQDVGVKVDSFPKENFSAKIDAIDSTIDPTANSVLVRGVIPNPKGRLKPGLFARVNLVVGAKDDVLIVPESAVLSSASEEYVFRVVEVPVQGVATRIALRVPVTTGLSEAGLVEVVRGLHEDDEVITVGISKVRDQYPVKVVEDVEAEEAFKEVEEENKELTNPAGKKNTKTESDKAATNEKKLEDVKPSESESQPMEKQESPEETEKAPSDEKAIDNEAQADEKQEEGAQEAQEGQSDEGSSKNDGE